MNVVGLFAFIERHTKILFRVSIQTLATPFITALLYIFVFGQVVGSRIGEIAGVSYIDFVLPGLVMMNIIMSSFSDTSSAVYFLRFMRSMDELLVAPFSYGEIIIGFVARGILRGLIVGGGVYLLALYFTATSIQHVGLFFLYAFSIALIFSLIGMLVGIWSNHFEHLAILNTFVIMPFIFLGGVFNSITMLPQGMQAFVRFNPFFYFVDGIRFAMLGVSEANAFVGAVIIAVLVVGLGTLVWYIFKVGYRIKT